MLFLQALLANRKEKDQDRPLSLLRSVLDARSRERADAAAATGVFDEYVQYNPDFMVEVAKEFLRHLHSPASVMTGLETDDVPASVQTGLDILENGERRARGEA